MSHPEGPEAHENPAAGQPEARNAAQVVDLDSEIEALLARATAGELTDADGARIAEVLNQAMPFIQDMLTMFSGLDDVAVAFSEAIAIFCTDLSAGLGIDILAAQPYKPEPRPGAELGGQPRNPEQDVIDDIDRLVDWQLDTGTTGSLPAWARRTDRT